MRRDERTMTRTISMLVAAVACVVAATAQDAPVATITKVSKEPAAESTHAMPQTTPRITTFMDYDVGRGETYAVYWAVSGRGLLPGTTVFFEYVLQNAPGVRALHTQYDFKIEGMRKTVFIIPEKDYRDGGNVKAWRARVVRAGGLLAEQTSPNWK